ncbi:hypothetical protein AVEN_38981-1 [Araneus ventricosus]|uniref:Uncharacterized protein n=1 Tax=Araneus ventricosus TaxID=182803 RepID=A0A4Y2KKR7_ARAVE|nr:hypothetical protein AVEN_38981-1 [Araneus ventricosus]
MTQYADAWCSHATTSAEDVQILQHILWIQINLKVHHRTTHLILEIRGCWISHYLDLREVDHDIKWNAINSKYYTASFKRLAFIKKSSTFFGFSSLLCTSPSLNSL